MLTAVAPLHLSCHVRYHVMFGYRELESVEKNHGKSQRKSVSTARFGPVRNHRLSSQQPWERELAEDNTVQTDGDRCERWSATSWFTHNIFLQNCTTNISVKNCGPVK